MDAIARMTADDVHEGLRRLGIEPARVLPWELERLLDEAPPVGLSARARPGLLNSAAESFALLRSGLGELLGPALTTAFMLLLIATPQLLSGTEASGANGQETVSRAGHREDLKIVGLRAIAFYQVTDF